MRKKTAAETIAWEKQYPTGSRKGYEGFTAHMDQRRQELLTNWKNGNISSSFEYNDYLAVYNNYPPKEFSEAYQVPNEAYKTHLNNVQKKYLLRFKNIRRAWVRILRFLPEAMNPRDKLNVLELSTAHGATLEVLRYFGHKVVGNDFSNDGLRAVGNKRTTLRKVNTKIAVDNLDHMDWPYKPIIDSIDLDVKLFDAGQIPYSFKKAEFDVVLCFDALEHYCHPKDWMKIIDEFVRISKKTVVVRINPIRREKITDDSYTPFVQTFVQDMLGYSKSGFRCILTEAEFNQPLYFKLMKIYEK